MDRQCPAALTTHSCSQINEFIQHIFIEHSQSPWNVYSRGRRQVKNKIIHKWNVRWYNELQRKMRQNRGVLFQVSHRTVISEWRICLLIFNFSMLQSQKKKSKHIPLLHLVFIIYCNNKIYTKHTMIFYSFNKFYWVDTERNTCKQIRCAIKTYFLSSRSLVSSDRFLYI